MISGSYINLDLLKLWWLDKKTSSPNGGEKWWFTVIESIKHHFKQTKKRLYNLRFFVQKQQNVMIKRPTTCNSNTARLAMEFFQSFFQLTILGRLVGQEHGKHKGLL